MQNKLWQKIKQNHLLMMIICCVAPLALIIIVVPLFKIGSDSSWTWLIFLLCPLMHFWMMKNHKHGESTESKVKSRKL